MKPFLIIFLSYLLFPLLLTASPPSQEQNLIYQTCKRTDYYNLCVSSLRTDPRSSSANVKGLALISLQLVLAKANYTFTKIMLLFENSANDSLLYRYYGTCVEEYGAAVQRHLPQAIQALLSNDYEKAKNEAEATGNNAKICEEQFTLTPFPKKSPLTARNKSLHDLSLVASSIIGTLGL